MSVDVKITIEGLALCFLREENATDGPLWNVAFLCDVKHRLDLKINGASQGSWRPRGDTTLYVEHSGREDCSGHNSFLRLLNLSSTIYGHGVTSDNPPRSNLNIRRLPLTTDLVWLQVPHAEIDVDLSENMKMMRTHPDHGVPKKVPARGKRIEFTFEADSPISLLCKAYPSGALITLPFNPIAANADAEINLEFNNVCPPDQCTRNDFVDLYEFVQDASGKKFISWAENAESTVVVRPEGTEPPETVGELESNGWVRTNPEEEFGELEFQKAEFKRLRDEGKSGPYGNCDPVGSDPPPGGP